MVLPMKRKTWKSTNAERARGRNKSRVSRSKRKCHGSALISSQHIIQFRFNLVIRRLRLLVKHDRNEFAAYGTNHKHTRPASQIIHARSEESRGKHISFFFPTCLTHEILFIINFIRFARKTSQFISIRTGWWKMT